VYFSSVVVGFGPGFLQFTLSLHQSTRVLGAGRRATPGLVAVCVVSSIKAEAMETEAQGGGECVCVCVCNNSMRNSMQCDASPPMRDLRPGPLPAAACALMSKDIDNTSHTGRVMIGC
jgi:hypothetical protein